MSPDMWLVNEYCEPCDGTEDTVQIRDNPSAFQLDDVLSRAHRPESLFEKQSQTVMTMMKATLLGALLLSLLSAVLHLFMTENRENLDLFEMLVMRHINVSPPF
eukprot:1988221-Rhodomonas_salina.1